MKIPGNRQMSSVLSERIFFPYEKGNHIKRVKIEVPKEKNCRADAVEEL